MEDNLNPQTPATPRPVTRRPMDDFNAPPTPRPMSIPVTSNDEAAVDSPAMNTKIADDITAESSNTDTATPTSAPSVDSGVQNLTTEVAPTPVPIMPETEKPETEKELIPGLNTKLEDDAFKDTPVSLTDTSEQKAPDIDPTKIDDKSAAGVVTSAQYKQPSKKGRGVAILVAVILALALIAGAAYAYLQNTKDIAPEAETNTVVTTPVKESTASEDIDTLNTEIDESLKAVNDTTDYQQNDLTDTTLGL
jgi:hypothetical protein